MKYTRKEVLGMFSRLTKAMKRTDLTLDYVACYGGYVIEEIGEGGSCSHPFGALRRSAREMYLSMEMCAQVLEAAEFEKQEMNKLEW